MNIFHLISQTPQIFRSQEGSLGRHQVKPSSARKHVGFFLLLIVWTSRTWHSAKSAWYSCMTWSNITLFPPLPTNQQSQNIPNNNPSYASSITIHHLTCSLFNHFPPPHPLHSIGEHQVRRHRRYSHEEHQRQVLRCDLWHVKHPSEVHFDTLALPARKWGLWGLCWASVKKNSKKNKVSRCSETSRRGLDQEMLQVSKSLKKSNGKIRKIQVFTFSIPSRTFLVLPSLRNATLLSFLQ